jgi:hypothetical protein
MAGAGRPVVSRRSACQWECGRPAAQPPQPPPPPRMGQAGGASFELTLEAKTESFFCSLVEPQWGQGMPFQRDERARISLSFLQPSQ